MTCEKLLAVLLYCCIGSASLPKPTRSEANLRHHPAGVGISAYRPFVRGSTYAGTQLGRVPFKDASQVQSTPHQRGINVVAVVLG